MNPPVCGHCGNEIDRRPGRSTPNWLKMKFCGDPCRNAARSQMVYGYRYGYRPWPLAPLLEAAQVDQATLAQLCGVDRSLVGQWARKRLTDRWADKAAVACGLHPEEVWDRWCDRALLPWWEPCPELEARWAWIDWSRDARRVLAEEWSVPSCPQSLTAKVAA